MRPSQSNLVLSEEVHSCFLRDSSLILLKSDSLVLLDERGGSSRVFDLACSNASSACLSGPHLVYVASGSDVLLLDLRKGSVGRLERLRGADQEVSDVACSPNGKLVIWCDFEGSLETHLPAPRSLASKSHGKATCASLCFVSNRTLVTGGADCCICVWDGRKGKLKKRVNVSSPSAGQVNPAFVHQVVPFSSSSVLLASGDGSASIYDVQEHSLHSFPGGHVGPATCVSKLSDSTFVSGGDDDRVALWDTSKEAPLLWWWAKETRINCLASESHAGGAKVLVGGPGGATLYDLEAQ